MLNKFFPPENSAVYDIVWINVVQPDRRQVAI
jgi:hypothetical protein